MLSFFRINASYQVILLILLLIASRLPLLLGGGEVLIPELQWMLVGEKLADGQMLYRQIWDSTPPFAAMVYAMMDIFFGRSVGAYHVAALVLTGIQVLYFNVMMHRQLVFTDRTYLPGLFYLLLSTLFQEAFTLSPALIATTFLLFAIASVFRQIDREGASDDIFEVGFFVGIATLFYPPAILFLPWAFFVLLVYSGATFRQHALSFCGFLLPLGFTSLFFYFYKSWESFVEIFLSNALIIRQYNLNDSVTVLLVMLLPVALSVLGFLRIIRSGRFSNFQTRVQQILALYLGAALLSVGLMPFLAPMQLAIFVPGMAFFCVHFFTPVKKKKWLQEAIFMLFLGGVLGLCYPSGALRESLTGQLRAEPSPEVAALRNERILVLGDVPADYLYNTPATSYLNWKVAKYDLGRLDYYPSVISILNKFQADPPTYLIDHQGLVPSLFQRIPAIGRQYRQLRPKVYQRTVK